MEKPPGKGEKPEAEARRKNALKPDAFGIRKNPREPGERSTVRPSGPKMDG